MDLNWTDIIEKILLAVGGYCAADLKNFAFKRRMRRQLYREISRNYHKLDLQIAVSTSLTGLAQAAPLRFAERMDISFDVWNFYHDEKRRAALFQLYEADAIARIYASVITSKAAIHDHFKNGHTEARNVFFE